MDRHGVVYFYSGTQVASLSECVVFFGALMLLPDACSGLAQVIEDFLSSKLNEADLQYLQSTKSLDAVEALICHILSLKPESPEQILNAAMQISSGPVPLCVTDLCVTDSCLSLHSLVETRSSISDGSGDQRRPSLSPKVDELTATGAMQRLFTAPALRWSGEGDQTGRLGGRRLTDPAVSLLNGSANSRWCPRQSTTFSFLRQHSTAPRTLERMQDGLWDAASSAVQVPASPSAGSFVQAMKQMPELNWEGYWHCPKCNYITQDSMKDHFLLFHEGEEVDLNALTPKQPTLASLLMNAEAFANGVCQDAPSLESVIALHIYTAETPIYRTVNEALRQGKTAVLEQWQSFISKVSHALQSVCPMYKGIAYRGIDVPIEDHLYRPGYVITWRAFTSATTSVKVARDFLSEVDSLGAGGSSVATSGTLFIIEAQRAQQVKDISTNPNEEEVLFSLNSQFRVIKRVTGGTVQLLESAMNAIHEFGCPVDLSRTKVLELRQVDLETAQGILDALTAAEHLLMGPLVAELSRRRTWRAEDLGSCGLYAIAMAFIMEHSEVINLLLAAGVPLGPDRHRVFCKLAEQCSVTVNAGLEGALQGLVDAGADIDAAPPWGDTALIAAVIRHNEGLVKMLLGMRASVHIRGRFQGTPLMFAAASGHVAIAVMLLERGAALGEQDIWGNRAVDWAVKYGNRKVLQLLTGDAAGGAAEPAPGHIGAELEERLLGGAPDFQNLSYILQISKVHRSKVPSSVISGLISIMHCSTESNARLIRGAILALARLLQPDADLDEDPAPSGLVSSRRIAYSVFTELWMTNENGALRRAAEVGMRLLHGARSCRLVRAFSNVVLATLDADTIWDFAPLGMEKDRLRERGWALVWDGLRSWERTVRIFAAVHLIATDQGAEIPESIWQAILNLVQFGDSIGRFLLEFLLYAALVQREHVPARMRPDLVRVARDLCMGSNFHNVRRAANCVWREFDAKFHPDFNKIFALQHDETEHRRSSWNFRAKTEDKVLRLPGLVELMCGVPKEVILELPCAVQQYPEDATRSAFSRYYERHLQHCGDTIYCILCFFHWVLHGGQLDEQFLLAQLQSDNRFMRQVALGYVSQNVMLLELEAVHMCVAELAKKDQVRGCVRREATSEVAPQAVRPAVGGGCQSRRRRLLSVAKCH